MITAIHTQPFPSSTFAAHHNGKQFDDAIGNVLPPQYSLDAVEISAGGQSKLGREGGNTGVGEKVLVDCRTHEGKVQLGAMALGKTTLEDWSAKGLEVTEHTLLAAADALQESMQKNFEAAGVATSGSRVALNRHQIVIDSQPVPTWFATDYRNTIASFAAGKLKDAFQAGEHFFVSPAHAPGAKALSRYAEIQGR